MDRLLSSLDPMKSDENERRRSDSTNELLSTTKKNEEESVTSLEDCTETMKTA